MGLIHLLVLSFYHDVLPLQYFLGSFVDAWEVWYCSCAVCVGITDRAMALGMSDCSPAGVGYFPSEPLTF